MYNDELDRIDEEKPRPGFLTVLCVLSFISTGLSLLFSLINFVSGPQSEEQMLQAKVQMAQSVSELRKMGMDGMVDMFNKLQLMSEEVNNNFYLSGVITLIVTVLGIFAVVKMWKGLKQGFHLYIVYSLLSVAGLYFYVSPSNIPSVVIIVNLILSGIFVLMYSRNLKWMK